MSRPLVNWIGRQSSGLPDANGIAGAGVSVSSGKAEIAQLMTLIVIMLLIILMKVDNDVNDDDGDDDSS